MFNLKNRAFQVKLVKTDDPYIDYDNGPTHIPSVDADQLQQMIRNQTILVAKAVAAVTASVIVLNTLSEIAVNLTNPSLRK